MTSFAQVLAAGHRTIAASRDERRRQSREKNKRLVREARQTAKDIERGKDLQFKHKSKKEKKGKGKKGK